MTRRTYEIRVIGSLGPAAREAFADMLVEVECAKAATCYAAAEPRSPRPAKTSRTTQRKPRWQVEVSMGWAIRAAGR